MGALQDLGMFSMTNNFDNEVEILKSRTLIKKVDVYKRQWSAYFLINEKIGRLHLWHYGRMLTSILFGGILTFLPYINPVSYTHLDVYKRQVITLCNQDGQPLMTLEKKAAPEVSLSDLSGEWVIELVNGKKIVAVSYTHLVLSLSLNIISN